MTREEKRAEFIRRVVSAASPLDPDTAAQLAVLLPPVEVETNERGSEAA